LRERKLAILRKLANDADIIFLQEVHGELTLFEVTLRDVCRDFWVSHSFSDDPGTGSVVTLVSKTLVPDGSNVVSIEVAKSRVIRTIVTGVNGSMHLWNIHNFGINAAALADVATSLRADGRETHLHPNRLVTFVGGDFNFYQPTTNMWRWAMCWADMN